MPQEEETEVVTYGDDHPWLEMPEDSVDEVIRFSLDGLWIGTIIGDISGSRFE